MFVLWPENCDSILSTILSTILRDGHMGIVRMKALARERVWWIKIDNDIENYVSECMSCNVMRKIKPEKDLISWPVTKKMYDRVHVDFFEFDKNTYLLNVYYFSKYI